MSTVNQNAERIVKGMKMRSASRFRRLYGKRAKEVMYATANKLAQKEQVKMGPTHDEVFSEAPKYDKQGNDKFDRSKRMIRHKQKKYGVSTFMQRLKTGADHNIDNEKKMKKEETINERGDFWHPDPDKDRKLGGPGANARAREDRAAASKPKSDSKKLRPGESYMDWNKRQKAAKMKKEELEMEGYKGKHGQSDKEYAASRSQGGKMISGDDKRSGAEYTHGRRVKAANPGMQPDVGGKTKPKSQGKMDKGTRADLQYRKANLKKEDVKSLDEKKKGLWANIHAKRKRGERAARPGEKDYPKTLNVESNVLKTCKQFVEGAAWTKKSGKSESGGLNEKGRKSYERENPGSDLKAPSKKVGNPRRASFCARMKGMRKRQKPSNNTGDDRLSKSLRAWNC